ATTFFAPMGFDGERPLAQIYCEPLDIPAASVGFVADSLQEGAGFEPSVPLEVLTVGIVPCRRRGPFHASLPKTKFAADSALEEGGFEPSVPLWPCLARGGPTILLLPL